MSEWVRKLNDLYGLVGYGKDFQLQVLNAKLKEDSELKHDMISYFKGSFWLLCYDYHKEE